VTTELFTKKIHSVSLNTDCSVKRSKIAGAMALELEGVQCSRLA